jgi:hypothetical protein
LDKKKWPSPFSEEAGRHHAKTGRTPGLSIRHAFLGEKVLFLACSWLGYPGPPSLVLSFIIAAAYIACVLGAHFLCRLLFYFEARFSNPPEKKGWMGGGQSFLLLFWNSVDVGYLSRR